MPSMIARHQRLSLIFGLFILTLQLTQSFKANAPTALNSERKDVSFISSKQPPRTAVMVEGTTSSATANIDSATSNDDEDKYRKKAVEAYSNIRYFSNAVLVSVFVDVCILLRKEGLRVFEFTWINGSEWLTNLSGLGLGIGLARVARIYTKSLDSRLDSRSGFILCRTMARVWSAATVCVGIDAIVGSTELKEHAGRAVGMYGGPVAVISIAVACGIILSRSSRAAVEKFAAEKPLPKSKKSANGSGTDIDDASIRSMGFVAVRNMSFFMSTLLASAYVLLVVNVAKPTSAVEKGFGMLDVLEPLFIAKLIGTLNTNFRRAVVNVTTGRENKDDGDVYYNLVETQSKTYEKLGNTVALFSVTATLPIFTKFVKRKVPGFDVFLKSFGK